jgi:hypothetical protein
MARAFADPYSLPLDTIHVPKAALFEIHTLCARHLAPTRGGSPL